MIPAPTAAPIPAATPAPTIGAAAGTPIGAGGTVGAAAGTPIGVGGGAGAGPCMGAIGLLNGWIAFAPGEPAPGGAIGNCVMGRGERVGIRKNPA